jgi:hypothetical protein
MRIHSRFAGQAITLAMTIVVVSVWSATQVSGRVPIGCAQVKDRVIRLQHFIKEPAPCEISEFWTGGTPVTPGEPFQEDGDWLNNITFSIKNVSGKSMTMVRVKYSFPEASRTRRTAHFVLQFGDSPSGKGTVGLPIVLPPGETLRFGMKKEQDFYVAQRFLNHNDLQMSNLTKVDISLYDVEFNDNTGWGTEPEEFDVLNGRWGPRRAQ